MAGPANLIDDFRLGFLVDGNPAIVEAPNSNSNRLAFLGDIQINAVA